MCSGYSSDIKDLDTVATNDAQSCYQLVSKDSECGSGFIYAPPSGLYAGSCYCMYSWSSNNDCSQRGPNPNGFNTYRVVYGALLLLLLFFFTVLFFWIVFFE